MSNTAEIAKFHQLAAHLWRGGRHGYYWTLPGKITSWRPANNPSDPPQGANVYFGIHPTAAPGKAGERAKLDTPRAPSVINCVFSEFDVKDFNQDWAKLEAHIKALVLKPSVIIHSGGGVHAYWLLEEPYCLDAPEKIQRATALQWGWVDYAGGDKGAKDLCRVLRVPGTVNSKYEPARPVYFVYANFGLVYNLEDFEQLIPQPEPKHQVQTTGEAIQPTGDFGSLLLKRALSKTGDRNKDCYWMAQQMCWNDFAKSEAEGFVKTFQRTTENSKPGEPAFTEKEALRTLESAYNSRPGSPWQLRTTSNGNGHQAGGDPQEPEQPPAEPQQPREPTTWADIEGINQHHEMGL